MSIRKTIVLASCSLLICVFAVGTRRERVVHAASADGERVEALDRLVTRLEDIEAVKRLQYVYGYYQDKFLVEQLVGLFSDNATADYDGGKYLGKRSISRLFLNKFTMSEALGKQGPQYGILNDHYVMQGVIDVAADGKSAKARFKDFVIQGVYSKSQSVSAGIYENEYVKENGVWKISSLVYCEGWRRPYLVGFADVPFPAYPPHYPILYPKDPVGPDRISNYSCHPFPYPGITPPMHYPNPVTGYFIYKP